MEDVEGADYGNKKFKKKESVMRDSNLELLRIFCIIFIIGDHFVGQSGIAQFSSFGSSIFYTFCTSLSRVACSVFIIISAWFLVDAPFKMKRISHVWLTVIMYTVPITLICKFIWNVDVSDEMLFAAFLPIEGCPLWFAGYYIILIIFSPVLNIIIHKCSKKAIEVILNPFWVLMVAYSTLTMRLGFFANEIWVLLFLYILTGYLKRYPIRFFDKKRNCFLLFFIIEGGICLIKALAVTKIAGTSMGRILINYMEFYRARLQTLPNLIMAFCLFYAFKNMRIKNSKIINKMAGVTLGVYCLHQVPAFYTFLWKNILKANHFVGTSYQYVYTIAVILGVWLVGTIVELIRSRISECLIEHREWYYKFCAFMDDMAENIECIETRETG